MAVKLDTKTRTLIYAAGIVVFLILLQVVWLSQIQKANVETQKDIERQKIILRDVSILKNEFIDKEYQIREYRDIISRRPADFSLTNTVSKVESDLNFRSTRMEPERDTNLGTEYKKSTAQYTYHGKTLAEIVDFLYRIEDPLNAINIEYLLLTPTGQGKQFNMTLKLSVVTLSRDES